MPNAYIDLRVSGALELRDAARALREQGRGKLIREIGQEIRKETKPAIQDVRRYARRILPRKGGLGKLIARSRMSTSVRTSAKEAGVSIVASNRHHIDRIDRGQLRHPLFGDREHWYNQQVPPHWFTGPLEANEDNWRRAVVRAIDRMIDEVERG